MGRPRKPGFSARKMLSGRMELSDYMKLEDKLSPPHKRMVVQDMLIAFTRSVISGSIEYDESKDLFVGGKKK